MEKKDKTILAIASGVFLMVLAFMLFVTFQSRDNLMNSGGRYNGGGIELGDAVCTWEPSETPHVETTVGDCTGTEPTPVVNGTYCKLIRELTGSEALAECDQTTCYLVQNQVCSAPSVPVASLSCPNVRVGQSTTCTVSGCTQSTCVINGGATSGDSTVAQVMSSGSDNVTVKGMSVGSTTITAIVNGESISASITVEAGPSNPITGISISCPSTIEIGSDGATRTCTATVTPSDHDDIVVWESGTESVATISNNNTGQGNPAGQILAISPGRTVIQACSQANHVCSNIANVTVTVNSNCTISAHDVSEYKHMSFDEVEKVRFDVTGYCGMETKVDLTLNGFTNNDGLETTAGVVGEYHPSRQDCKAGTIKGCIKNDGTKCSETISIVLMPNWDEVPTTASNVSEELHLQNKRAANLNGRDVAYENCQLNNDELTYTCDRYTRGCGGQSGGDTTHCYIKRGNGTDNEYCHGTAAQCSGFSETISSSSCSEETKCYLKTSDNTYVTGKFAGQEGYVEQTGDCPTEGLACYKKADKTYAWTTAEAAGENAVLISSIQDADSCKPACYMDNENKYDWGIHAGDPNYTLVQGITSSAACKPEKPDVPPTAANIATIMYIAVAVFTTIGVGFIAYTSLKKNSI